MQKLTLRKWLLAGALGFTGAAAHATNISGTISSTLTITENSVLVGDVACTVTSAPCIKFGAPGITLNLNRHIMTGRGGQLSCTLTFGETGIDTNSFDNVVILGPGIVRRFNDIGIVVSGNNALVTDVTVLSSCREAMRVLGSQNQILDNSLDLASLDPANPLTFAVLFISGANTSAGSNHILRNEVIGAAYGIFVGEPGQPSNNNEISVNNASRNNFAGIAILQGSSGNQISNNQALANANASPAFAEDIVDLNPPGTNTYQRNLCETSSVGSSTGGKNICLVLHNQGHRPGL